MEFLKAKFDNICLLLLIGGLIGTMLHISHDKQDADLINWVEQAITTVLGAYIGLTQAGRVAWNKLQGGTNGTTSGGSSAATSSNVLGLSRVPEGPVPSVAPGK